MKDEAQKLIGEFVFDALDKQEGITLDAFAAFLNKLADRLHNPYGWAIERIKDKMKDEALAFYRHAFQIQITALSDPAEEETYHIGQRFRHEESGEEYILAATRPTRVNLICLDDGEFWNSELSVTDATKIPKKEFAKLTGGRLFTLLT